MNEADPRTKLETFPALIGEWTIEMTHPPTGATIPPRATSPKGATPATPA